MQLFAQKNLGHLSLTRRVIMSEADGGKPHLIFTYGTLKQGFPNHPLLQDLISKHDAVLVGTFFTHHSFPLVSGLHGIPYLIHLPGSGHRVKGELYSVSTRGLLRLDELEGIRIGHYERLPILVVDGAVSDPVEAESYFAHRNFGEALWKKKGEVGMSEYTEQDAREYLRIEERPRDRSVVDDLAEFVCSAPN